MKKIIFGLTAQLLALGYSGIIQSQINLADSFQICINNHIQNYKDKGISACVIMPDGSVWNGAAGIGKSSQPITTSTQFYSASTSKTFLAACFLKLIEAGTININSPLYQYVPSSKYPSNYIDSTVTIKQLLKHTSGVYSFTKNSNYFSSITVTANRKFKKGEALTQFVNRGAVFPKGTGFDYSNSNYTLLAMIIESATGQEMNDLIKTQIIQPLNLTATFPSDSLTPNSDAGFWANTGPTNSIFWDVNLSNRSHTALLTSMWGPAHMVTTSYELARYCRALIGGQLYTNPNTVNDMMTIEPMSLDVDGYGYGLGLERFKFAGNYLFGHTGNLGHITYMFHSPMDGYTIVTMTNRFSTAGSDNRLAFQALERILLRHLNEPVGIKESAESVFALYPNPAQNTLTLTLKKQELVSISFTDIIGNEVLTQSNYSLTNDINISSLTNGIYFVKVQQGNNVFTQKLIISK